MEQNLNITEEMLEKALLCCATDEPAEKYPCEGCYLYRLSKDGRMSTGRTCFEHLAHDVIDWMHNINDFEHSQCAKLLAENGELKKALEMACERIQSHDDCPPDKYNNLCGNECTECWLDYFIQQAKEELQTLRRTDFCKTCGIHTGKSQFNKFACTACKMHKGDKQPSAYFKDKKLEALDHAE